MERAKRRHIQKCVKECSAEQIMNRLFKIFWDTVKEDPDYVCTCCHRLMYRKTVVEFQRSKYKERLQEIIGLSLRRSVKQKVWICITCHRSLKQGRLPARAKANNLELEDIPAELSDLNVLEKRLVCLRIPFMKMVALPRGKQGYSWTCSKCTNKFGTFVYSSSRTSLSSTTSAFEIEEEAELQRSLHV